MYDIGDFSDRFSESGQRVMKRAIEESRRRDHNFIAPEHIFIAISDVERPLFNEVMQNLHVDPQAILNEINSKLAVPKQYTGKRVKLPDSTRELLTAGLWRARKSRRHTIEATDLFQALFDKRVRKIDNILTEILQKLGVEPEMIIGEIAKRVQNRDEK